jgi:hypothetical protein
MNEYHLVGIFEGGKFLWMQQMWITHGKKNVIHARR